MSKLSPLHEMTERAGAAFADDAGWSMPRHFGDAIAEYNDTRAAASLFDVSNRGKIQVTGKDAASFLHMERTFGVNVNSHIRRHDPLGVAGYDLVCLNALAPGLWRMLTESGAKPAGFEAYELLRVEAGTPVYGKDITEERFAFDIGRT